MCELAVPIRYKGLLRSKSIHNITKREETLIDGRRLLQVRTVHTTLFHAFGASQINDAESRTRALRRTASPALCQLNLENCVAAARSFVHPCLGIDEVRPCTGE